LLVRPKDSDPYKRTKNCERGVVGFSGEAVKRRRESVMANRKTREIVEAVEATLIAHSASEICFIHNKHITVRFKTARGESKQYTFPGTPGDRRSLLNTVCGVRRLARG
jgi:hypothetical protein